MLPVMAMEESELNGIEDFPDEILLQVFSHLTLTEMLQSVSPVCKRWNSVSKDPSLYRHVVFPPHAPPTTVAVQIVEMAILLTSLQLTDRTDADEILSHVGSGHPSLKALVVRYCKGTPEKRIISSVCVHNIVNHCHKLENFSLVGSYCDSPELYKDIGLKLPMLRYIDFGYAEEYFSVDAILNVVDRCHHVEELHVFHSTLIPGDVMAAFCDKFRASLLRLDIIPVAWNNVSLGALSRCAKLTTVELIFARSVTDRGVMAIADMPNLVDVSIWGACHVTERCWIDLVGELATRAIKWLCFQHCEHVTDEVGRAIARELRGLKELQLMGNAVTEEGFLEIRQMLPIHCHYEFRDELDFM